MSIMRILLIVLTIAVLLPSPPERPGREARAAATVEPTDTIVGAALETLVDLDPLCEGREGVCTTAGYLIGRVEAKALYNIGLLYGWARSEHIGREVSPLGNQADAGGTASRRATMVSDGKRPQNTLRLDDFIPEWRGPGGAASI
ncbi:MAG TPA: hypothetical protein VIB38_14805 [Aestuariivirgaceae bacterium]|jgi:hypothetical protein